MTVAGTLKKLNEHPFSLQSLFFLPLAKHEPGEQTAGK